MELIKMKKALLCISLIIVVLALSGCSGQEEYPFDFVGLYDNNIQQSIEIDMPMDRIRNLLGTPTESESRTVGGMYLAHDDYDDGPFINYDRVGNNVIVDSMSVFEPIEHYYLSDEENEERRLRYELPGGINFDSTVTDFINLYDNVYEVEDQFDEMASYTNEQIVAVFIEKTDDGFKVLSKKDLAAIALEDTANIVYQMSIEYQSYDSIQRMIIEKFDIDYYLRNHGSEWIENSLTDINQDQ